MSLGVSAASASAVKQAAVGLIQIASREGVSGDARMRGFARIGVACEILSAIQAELNATGSVSLRNRSQLSSSTVGMLATLLSLQVKAKEASAAGLHMEEEFILEVSTALMGIVRNLAGAAVAIPVGLVIDAQLHAFRNVAISLGVREQVIANSIGHFNNAILMAFISRLQFANINPQVIRIVSELLSRSTVIDEGFSMSRIVEETIQRAE